MASSPLPRTDSSMSSKGCVLIADSEPSNRFITTSLLRKLNYQIIEAETGHQVVELYLEHKPDIILMDVILPGQSGLEVAQIIKQKSRGEFTPIIFVTAMSDRATLSQCIEVGGDDFVSKPFSHTILTAKIHAMERIRRLHQEVNSLYRQMQADEDIAERVFSGAVISNNVATATLQSTIRAAERFSGDVLLTAHAPSGELHILLGDFTGHGLAAALGAMPAADVFRTMAAKGFGGEQIMEEINNKLCTMLPTGMFMAAQFIRIDIARDFIQVTNCGMPDIGIIDTTPQTLKERIPSGGLPLGIVRNIGFHKLFQRIAITSTDTIVMVSDGVPEARNPQGDMLGQDQLFEWAVVAEQSAIFESIDRGLKAFCEDARQEDDISIVVIPCVAALAKSAAHPLNQMAALEYLGGRPDSMLRNTHSTQGSSVSISLHGHELAIIDPVPVVISHLQAMYGTLHNSGTLFTILSELYINALDHGILQLNSQLKAGEDGFSNYFNEREQRLERLEEGTITLTITVDGEGDNRFLKISVEDSGLGFNPAALDHIGQSETGKPLHSGRGIMLVRGLCEAVHYSTPGNTVTAHCHCRI